MKGYWKVPRRQVYCDSFAGMLRAAFWCHVVCRVFPYARDLGKDALVEHYLVDPPEFFRQYEYALREIAATREVAR